ncbi:MAG: hypothetical protein HY791_13765 [Deltaproteobacteria bacterium]|nr:hypothetical protein [Deltaproteobacteria bacterium]
MKLSVSMDTDLAKRVMREARGSKLKTSTWIADVIREHFRQQEAKKLLDELDAKQGPVDRKLREGVRRQWPVD